MSKKKEAKTLHILPSKVDGQVTDDLMEKHPAGIAIDSALSILKKAREDKQAFKAEPEVSAILERKKDIDGAEREARRTLYSLLLHHLEGQDKTMQALADELDDGLGYMPRYEVRGDEAEIEAWCQTFAPFMLQVNRSLFDELVKSMASKEDYPSGASRYVTRSLTPPPAKVVQTTLPTISDDLPSLSDEDFGEDDTGAEQLSDATKTKILKEHTFPDEATMPDSYVPDSHRDD